MLLHVSAKNRGHLKASTRLIVEWSRVRDKLHNGLHVCSCTTAPWRWLRFVTETCREIRNYVLCSYLEMNVFIRVLFCETVMSLVIGIPFFCQYDSLSRRNWLCACYVAYITASTVRLIWRVVERSVRGLLEAHRSVCLTGLRKLPTFAVALGLTVGFETAASGIRKPTSRPLRALCCDYHHESSITPAQP